MGMQRLLVSLPTLEDLQDDEDTYGLVPGKADTPAADTQAILGRMFTCELAYVALVSFRKSEHRGDDPRTDWRVEAFEIAKGSRLPIEP